MTDLDKMALLPCPFCGNPNVQPVTIQDADGDALHAVGCPKCGCNGTPHVAAMDDPRPAAVAAWNRRALLAAPPGYVLVDRAQIGTALDFVRSAMEAAFHRRFPECCGSYSPAGCCGNLREAWSEDDRATMDTLHPVEQALSAMLAAAPEPEA